MGKVKRTISEVYPRDDEGQGAEAPEHTYMLGLSEQVQAMADAALLVQNQTLPVHVYVLAMQSPVFAEAFGAAQSPEKAHGKPAVPLVGDKLQDVCTALKYLYQASYTISSTNGTPAVQSVEDAASLVRFGHKYAIQPLLEEGERYLVAQASINDGATLFKDKTSLVAWVVLAESCNLSEFLAHAELYMINHTTDKFWEGLLGNGADGISQQCFLRVLRATRQFRTTTVTLLTSLKHGMSCDLASRTAVARWIGIADTALLSQKVTIQTLMRWHKEQL